MALHAPWYPLMPAPTLFLASTAGVMLAADVPLPVEISAMAMVGLFLRWLMQRDSRNDEDVEKRLKKLEKHADWQRHLKHVFLNRLAYCRGTFLLVRQQALLCKCGAMTPVLALLTLETIDNLTAVPPEPDDVEDIG